MGPHYHDETTAVHGGVVPEKETGAIMTPIFQTSTFVQEEPGVHKGFDYSRADNPTRQVYEESLACLEGASYGLSFSSGLAAVQAILQTLESGSRVLVSDDVYGGTGRLFRNLFAKYQIDFIFLDMTDLNRVEEALKTPTHLVWLETPSNPTLKIIDIEAVAALIKKTGHKTTLVVDNTFCSPIFQKPLKLGADLVLHSTTKYIGGHSDLIGGAIMTSHKKLFEELKFIQFAAGSVPGPFDCFLFLRSIKTLAIRMAQHQKNALHVAQFLEGHSKVARVLYPGLKSHPGHLLACKQMSGFSGMISFEWQGEYHEMVTFMKKLKLFALAESLGGVESLINHPEKMTHASVPPEHRKELGIHSHLIRLSVGVESCHDLVADLEQAMAQ